MDSTPALRVALDLINVPSRVRAARDAPMPTGVVALLEIAAGNLETGKAASATFDRPLEAIQAAAVFFIEQVMLAPDADSYRVLGASPGAPSHELRRNMALLLRWLHPDTGDADGRSLFTGRVTNAWETLKTAERREAYDRELAARLAYTRNSRHRRGAADTVGRPRIAPPSEPPAFFAQLNAGKAGVAYQLPTRHTGLVRRIFLAMTGRRPR